MNFNNLPNDIKHLIFQHKRDLCGRQEKNKIIKWYNDLDEDEQDELDEAVMDYIGGTNMDLSYLEEDQPIEAIFLKLKLKDMRWFYDRYWKAYNFNHDIMVDGYAEYVTHIQY